MKHEPGDEFMVATESEAATGAEKVSRDGVQRVAFEAAYGLDDTALTQLGSLADGRDGVIDVPMDCEEVFAWCKSHGPWLLRLPDDFVRALAGVQASSIGSLAEAWVDVCYAFQGNEVPREWVENVISQLARVARQAIEQNKSMYWQVPSC